MKKTLKDLAEKMDTLQEKNDGTLEGGFGSVKGGTRSPLQVESASTNDGCTNSLDCSTSTNKNSCSNTGIC